ncbi:MAG: DIP1984 family protein [Solobacterium sp.]|nr:DIP1984 family protein [Solobacterium sp.]
MKLAEALQERADLNRKIQQLNSRLSLNATAQEGEPPAEDPADLLRQADACFERLEQLIAGINLTNSTTVVGDKTLTELIAGRDVLIQKIASYRSLAAEASSIAKRAARTEIRILSTVDVKDLQKQIDDMSRQLRITENLIQSVNWTTELK